MDTEDGHHEDTHCDPRLQGAVRTMQPGIDTLILLSIAVDQFSLVYVIPMDPAFYLVSPPAPQTASALLQPEASSPFAALCWAEENSADFGVLSVLQQLFHVCFLCLLPWFPRSEGPERNSDSINSFFYFSLIFMFVHKHMCECAHMCECQVSSTETLYIMVWGKVSC